MALLLLPGGHLGGSRGSAEGVGGSLERRGCVGPASCAGRFALGLRDRRSLLAS
eukprot:COSAG02_NODE_40595_length_403_cov_3.009868_2_plen_53_part_01